MQKIKVLMASLLFLAVFIVAPIALAQDYAGSEKCFRCHPQKYNDWKTSGHPYKLRSSSDAKFAPVPLPKGYSWDDISYMIGGFRWKARYMDKNGFIITTDKEGKPMPTQWNIQSGAWVNYLPGEKKKYDCGGCHTTGYSKTGNQDGLPGIVGTWAAPGIQCEACHGPGGNHVRAGDKSKIKRITSSELCGQCHIRGEKGKIPAAKGFIDHHEQYNEYMASPHAGKIDCQTCHDPHKPARFGIRKPCAECHDKAAASFKGSRMEKSGVQCIDCHMPRAGRSAGLMGFKEGDIRTHNWKISPDPKASMFSSDGKFAIGILTLDFVCLHCHQSRDVNWAAQYAKQAHAIGK